MQPCFKSKSAVLKRYFKHWNCRAYLQSADLNSEGNTNKFARPFKILIFAKMQGTRRGENPIRSGRVHPFWKPTWHAPDQAQTQKQSQHKSATQPALLLLATCCQWRGFKQSHGCTICKVAFKGLTEPTCVLFWRRCSVTFAVFCKDSAVFLNKICSANLHEYLNHLVQKVQKVRTYLNAI